MKPEFSSETSRPKGDRLGFCSYLSTLFLGALNDNISKLLAICYATAALGNGSSRSALYLSLASACFILPYLLFANEAGYLADRFPKKRIMVWTKVLEIFVMAVGFFFALGRSLYGLLFVLFLMGSQSAFFSPAKYGFLPETHPREQLSKCNGVMQLFTYTAIILGGWAGGLLSAHCQGTPARGFLVCIGIAILGTLASFFITPTSQCQPDLKYHPKDPIWHHLKTLHHHCQEPLLRYAVVGNAFFWFLGTVVQLELLLFAKEVLHGDDKLVGILQAVIGLGIAAGCLLAGLFSRKKIPYHFIAPSGMTLGLALLLLGCVGGTNNLLALVLVLLAGISGGFFMLPISTTLQERSPLETRGRFLAATNVLDCLSMLLGSLYLFVLPAIFHCGPRSAFLILAILTFSIVIWITRGLKS